MSRQPDYVSDDGAIQLYCGDCLEVLPGLADSSVSLIATDLYLGKDLEVTE